MLSSLMLDPRNARAHPDDNLQAIAESLKKFGQVEPLVVQESTGKVIGGNGRLAAMVKLGWQECDVVRVDVDDTQAAALGIALNRTAELATWNDKVLSEILEDLKGKDALAGIGFTARDAAELLAKIADGTGGKVDEDQIPEQPFAAASRAGDIWILGSHRVMCGDSASPADLDRLTESRPVHLADCDPPYNVRVEPRSNNAIASAGASMEVSRGFDKSLRKGPITTGGRLRPKDRRLKGDFISDAQFDVLLDAWFGNISRVLEPGRAFYIWGGYSNWHNYTPIIRKHGLFFHQGIIWAKQHPVLVQKDFMGNHECAWYGWKEGSAHQWFGPMNVPDVWEVKKISPQIMIHLTEKPVELARRAIQYSSRVGERVLDLFGGSGSTLIGCEETQRCALLMEIDPLYVDVIVKRWETYTGKTAVLEGSGKSFAEICEERVPAPVPPVPDDLIPAVIPDEPAVVGAEPVQS